METNSHELAADGRLLRPNVSILAPTDFSALTYTEFPIRGLLGSWVNKDNPHLT